ncbi:MAG: hypothetical protein ABI990_08275, partial [Actinomycetota bacterium]
YSVMQTSTSRGMQTMEQSLADLVIRGVITPAIAFSRSSRPDQLEGLLERSGFAGQQRPSTTDNTVTASPTKDGLRLAAEA